MNESFIHHVVRVALILGILVGIGGFALLLYAADFWSDRSSKSSDSVPSSRPAEAAPEPQPESPDFGHRAVWWLFGAPDNPAPDTNAGSPP